MKRLSDGLHFNGYSSLLGDLIQNTRSVRLLGNGGICNQSGRQINSCGEGIWLDINIGSRNTLQELDFPTLDTRRLGEFWYWDRLRETTKDAVGLDRDREGGLSIFGHIVAIRPKCGGVSAACTG